MNAILCRTQEGGFNNCEEVEDPNVVYDSLSDDAKAYYKMEESQGPNFPYQIVFDITYKMRNLATQYFVFKANQVQAGGFGAFEFFNYELENPRTNFNGMEIFGTESDAEMFGLAGFAGRETFLVDFHNWLVANLNAERTPLEVAESVDMMRVLEHGMKVKMVPTSHSSYSVDTPDDLARVEQVMKSRAVG